MFKYERVSEESFERSMRRGGYNETFAKAAYRKRRMQNWEESVAKAKAAAVLSALDRTARSILVERGAPRWVREIVSVAAISAGVSPLDIVGESRQRSITTVREEILYLLKERKPELSFPQLGRWFGRDHTTVMYAVAKYAKRTGKPPLSGYDLSRVKVR